MTENVVPPYFEALASQAADRLARGDGIDAVIRFVHNRSGGIFGTIWIIRRALGIGLQDARDLVENSPTMCSGG